MVVVPDSVGCWSGSGESQDTAQLKHSLEMVSLLPRPQQEAESNLRKAKQGYVQRCEDHDKARLLVAKTEEEQAGTGPGAGGTVSKALDKRRRLEEEAKNKVGVSGRRPWRTRPSGGRS